MIGLPTCSNVLRTAEPVSYTHLDVYKRQYAPRPEPAGTEPINTRLKFRLKAVSYTHLLVAE